MIKQPPAINLTAFNCPHCGAFTSQQWFHLRAEEEAENGTPTVASTVNKDLMLADPDIHPEAREFIGQWYARLKTGQVLMENSEGKSYYICVENLNLSKCYNCKRVAVWVAETLVFPTCKLATPANPDLPDHILPDFEEARSIVDSSPRGAAALLRLCIQKLCAHLGEKGKRIDDDIGSLVKKGLNPVVQRSLDIVRVIGNEAVHPGVIDLNDDRTIAISLFDLVNTITDQMISHPKKVNELYAKLPDDKRRAIEKRDQS